MKRNSYSYSVNRFFVFHEYCKSASSWRVFFVICLYPILALMSLILLEVVPLQDPSEGWRGNWVFWLRNIAALALCTSAGLVQVRLVEPDIAFTAKQIVLNAFGASVGTVGASMLLASLQGSMLFIYPTYNAMFLSLEGIPQLSLVVLLPAIKYGLKRMIAKSQTCDQDIFVAVLSCVDIFDAMCMTKCIQSAGTLLVGVGIIVVDMAQNMFHSHKLSKHTLS